MPHQLKTAQRGALGDAMSVGHSALYQSSSTRERSSEGCAVFRAKAGRANALLYQLPFHPSLGTWAKWMKLEDFTCAAASASDKQNIWCGLLAMTVAGEEVIG